MSDIILRGGRVIDPSQNLDAERDVLIASGTIAEISPPGKIASGKAREIAATGLIVAPGFIDLHAHLREPGYEYKESILSGTAAAVHGGFTAVCCMANTNPVNDNASVTDYILRKAVEEGYCKVYPIGAITKGLKGCELAPIAELKSAGCVAVSDDGLTVQNARLMRLALDYAKSFGLPVTTHSIEMELARDGPMNESFMSTKLGLQGSPNVAEDLIIARDIMLAELTGAHLHVGHLSTAGGIRLVREAKQRCIHVTCEVTPHHFTLTDASLADYDTNFKMCPPLRTKDDVTAIRDAFKQGGVIDAIATDHAPHGVIDKEIEFDKAADGIIGFETALPLALDLVREKFLTLPEMIRLMSVSPALLFNLPGGTLKPGSPADIVMFDPGREWTLTREHVFSKSKNSPWLGKKLKGEVMFTIVGGRVRYQEGKGVQA